MKPVYFSICRAFVTHPDQWTIVELRIEKGIYDDASFSYATFKMKNKSAKNMLNNDEPSIEPWGTPKTIYNQEL